MTVSVPAGSAMVVQVAVPAVIACVPQAGIAVPPFVKLTVPADGARVAGATGATVAVKMTGWPQVVVLSLVTTPAVVPAGLTVWLMLGDVLVP